MLTARDTIPPASFGEAKNILYRMNGLLQVYLETMVENEELHCKVHELERKLQEVRNAR